MTESADGAVGLVAVLSLLLRPKEKVVSGSFSADCDVELAIAVEGITVGKFSISLSELPNEYSRFDLLVVERVSNSDSFAKGEVGVAVEAGFVLEMVVVSTSRLSGGSAESGLVMIASILDPVLDLKLDSVAEEFW